MSDKRKTITISVQDDFSRQLKEFARLLDQGQGELTDLQNATGRGGSGFSNMAKNVDHATTALRNTYAIARDVIGTMIDLANQGTKIQQSAFAFERLAGGAQEAQKWIDAIQTAGRGSVTQFEATSQAIQLMTMGLADSAEEAGRFMEIAAITAAINPELGSIENAITNIGLTLANDSWMRLDQLGVDATRAKERIEELKNEGMAMTEAFDVAVLEQLEENAATIGTEVLDIGKNTAEMQANWRELKDTASEFALVIMEEISPAMTFIIDQLNTFVAGWHTLLTEDSILNGTFQTGAGTPRLADDPNFVPVQETVLDQWYAANGMTQNADGEWEIGDPVVLPIEPQLELGTNWLDVVAAAFAEANPLQTGIVDRTPIGGPRFREVGPREGYAAAQSATLMANSISSILAGIVPNFNIHGASTTAGTDLGMGVSNLMLPGRTATATSIGLPMREPGETLDKLGAMDAIFNGEFAVNLDDVKAASGAFADNMERAVQAAEDAKFDNLADKFGIDPDSFDVDVFSEMSSALRDVGVDADTAAEAMENYQLMTGMATGGSELFEGQLERLSEELDQGIIDADTYAQKVMELGQLDLSNIDQTVSDMIAGGNLEGAKEFIDQLATMDLTQLQETLSSLAPTEGEDGEGNVFQSLMDGALEMEEAVTLAGQTASDNVSSSMDDLSSRGVEAFGGLKSSAIADMEEVVEYINQNFNGTSWTLTASVNIGDVPAIPAGSAASPNVGGSVPAFAEGGYTGRGSSPFMAMLHPNEMVIPLNKMPAGRGGVSIGTVIIQDSSDPVATWDALEREAKRRNRAFGGGQAGIV